jgi:hypothetical protein
MNASAIYSKSGKGVQEASGKTSHLSRSDRAVLAAIDGRATLGDVAQKVGKAFDPAFEKLIETLDKGGFIREVAPGAPAAAPKPGAGAKPAAKPTGPIDVASDLDFTTALSMPRGKAAPPPQAPPKAAPPPPKPAVPIPPPPPPPSAAEKVQAEKSAKEQQDAFAKAREEAERKAQADRDRVKSEAEARMRAETEAKMRADAKTEADKKFAAELEAKSKAAREAAAKIAAEAKAKAEAEAKKAREEAERAREEAERARAEAERVRREQEELKRKLEEERRAREEAERKAREEAKRLEEERRNLEEERKAREAEKRREDEERAARRKREEEEEARARAQKEKEKEKEKKPEPEPAPAKAAGGGGFSDTLLADLESFTTRDDEEQKEREEAALKERVAAVARAREAEEQRQKDDAERQSREEKARRKQEEAERKAQEEAELREAAEREKRRLEEEEEKRRQEAEERERKAKQEERAAASATRGAQQFDHETRSKRERGLMARGPRTAASGKVERKGWGKPIAVTLFLLLVAALAVAHVMPIDTSEYERAASDALGRPVKIGSARLSLVTGLQLKFSDVSMGDTIRIAEVRAFPEFDALTGPRKAFSRIEIDRMKAEQDALGQALFTKVRSETFSVGRLAARNVELAGPLTLPKGLEYEVIYGPDGAVRAAFVRGPEGLTAKLTPKGQAIEVDMSASSFTLPFAPEITLSKFSLKGDLTPQRMAVAEWDGGLLNGTVSGTATVRWGDTWTVDGVVTARNIYAAVFAPALLSDGRAEGSGKFVMRGEPGKLASVARLDGSFNVSRGVLGSIDLAKAIQSGGKQVQGRTQFNEMNGQASYDRGALALRNVTISAGQLNAGASVDIAQNGALSGRIVADVRVASQHARATLNVGGTLKEPQVRN